MSTGKQAFLNDNANTSFAVRANDPNPPGAPFTTQAEAIHRFAFPSPATRPNDEPFRDHSHGPDKWRPA